MDEGEAVGLIEQVCEAMGKKPPRDVVFRTAPHSYVTYARGGRIILPRSSFIRHYQIVDDDCETRLLVLHETTHYLVGPGHGHKPEPFYTLLFTLCEAFGVPLEYARVDEVEYRPRYAQQGWARYQEQKSPPVG